MPEASDAAGKLAAEEEAGKEDTPDELPDPPADAADGTDEAGESPEDAEEACMPVMGWISVRYVPLTQPVPELKVIWYHPCEPVIMYASAPFARYPTILALELQYALTFKTVAETVPTCVVRLV